MNDNDILGWVILSLGIAVLSVVVLIIILVLLVVSFVGVHYLVAWLVLSLGRSRAVRAWFIDHGWIRPAIYFWLWILPASVALIVTGAWWLWLIHQGISPLFALGLALAASGLLLHFYYQLYVAQMPHAPDWPIFVGATRLMELEWRLAWIERRTQATIWWLRLWAPA